MYLLARFSPSKLLLLINPSIAAVLTAPLPSQLVVASGFCSKALVIAFAFSISVSAFRGVLLVASSSNWRTDFMSFSARASCICCCTCGGRLGITLMSLPLSSSVSTESFCWIGGLACPFSSLFAAAASAITPFLTVLVLAVLSE